MTTGILLNGLPTAQSDKITILNEMGLSTVRDSILTTSIIGTWKNSKRLDMWRDNGFQMMLNINYVKQGKESPFPTGSDIGTQCKLAQLIASKYPCNYFTCENEALNPSFHCGTKEQYIDYLTVFIEAIHNVGGKVIDSGSILPTTRSLTYRWLAETDPTRAAKFLNECIPTKDRDWLVNRNVKRKEIKLNDALWYLNCLELLPIDGINFHCYFPIINRGSTDPTSPNGTAGLKEICEFLRATCPGKKLVSNEIGMVVKDYDLSKQILAAFENEGIEICLYSKSGGDGSYHKSDLSLTQNGIGVKDYINSISL